MKFIVLLPVALGISAFASSVHAQDRAEAAAAAAAKAQPTAQDCARTAVQRHDHGSERGIPTPVARQVNKTCDTAGAAPAAVQAPKGKPVHDHGKIHKNQ